jgi:hypothetical protein
MNLEEIKAVMLEAEKEAEKTLENYAEQSATHQAALQIMQFVKDLHYGDLNQSRHLQKIKQIIEDNMEDINNEIN